MHFSKKLLYIGIIIYSLALLLVQDWYFQNVLGGRAALLFLMKMVVDVCFIGASAVRLFGPSLFATETGDDYVTIHAEDLHFSDTALYSAFFVNVLVNLMWHVDITINTTGGVSFVTSIWVMVEILILFATVILWKHAAQAQRKLAKSQGLGAGVRPLAQKGRGKAA